MDKKKLKQYGILMVLVIVISLIMPRGIRIISNYAVSRIIRTGGEKETGTETETDTEGSPGTEIEEAGTYSIGNPDLYVEKENPGGNVQSGLVPGPEGSDPELARKYEEEVRTYENYVAKFNPEYIEAEKGIMDQFLINKEKFHDTIATFAFVKWGTDRVITRVQFDAISVAYDDNPEVTCLIEFFHTSHPDTENGTMSFCVYNKAEDTYSFT